MRGRIRTVKPEVFSDEILGDLEQQTKLPVFRVFVGLWCFADRDGRFEWAPRALRGAIMPCWDGDMAAALEALASKSYIVRYTVGGKDYGFIRSFARHQNVNQREAASTLPPPSAHAVTATHMQGNEQSPDCTNQSVGNEWSGVETRGEREGDRPHAPAPDATGGDEPPSVPGLKRVGVFGGGVARTYTMPSQEAPEEYISEAMLAGVSRAQADSTWKHYFGAGLPDRGVERLIPWMVQRAKERATSTARVDKKHGSAQPNAGKTGWE